MSFLDFIIERGAAIKKVPKQFPKLVYECDSCGAVFEGKCLRSDYGIKCGSEMRQRFKNPKTGRFVLTKAAKDYPPGFLVTLYFCGFCNKPPPLNILCSKCGKGHLILKESV